MVSPVTARRQGHVPAPLDRVFDVGLNAPLPDLYRRRYALLPPIVAVADQVGAWATPGQTRTFTLADGGRMREELLRLDPGRGFANRLTVLSGPFFPLVHHIDEAWSFRGVDGGTEATWDWELHPRTAVTRPLVALVARLWRGYADRVITTLGELAQDAAGSS